METVSEKLHFSVHGDFVTRFVRDLVLSDEHVKAIDTLRTLEGLPLEEMYQILTGTKKLVGINYLGLEDDNDTEYIESLKYKFGGVVKSSNAYYYKPYAYVRSYGYKDYMFSYQSAKHLDRAEYYKHNKTDIVRMLDIKVREDMCMTFAVLFEQVLVPDFITLYFNVGRDFQEALDMYLERHSLEIIDAEEIRTGDWPSNKKEKQVDKKEEEDSNPIVSTGKPDKQGRSLSSFRSGDQIVRQYAWVLPSGDSYECEYMEHVELAYIICEEVYGFDPRTTIYDGKERPSPDGYLEKIGAIKLGSSYRTSPYVHYDYDSKKLYTQAQLNKVYDWCEANEVAFPAALFEELE